MQKLNEAAFLKVLCKLLTQLGADNWQLRCLLQCLWRAQLTTAVATPSRVTKEEARWVQVLPPPLSVFPRA